jgi:hypothetical protein
VEPGRTEPGPAAVVRRNKAIPAKMAVLG